MAGKRKPASQPALKYDITLLLFMSALGPGGGRNVNQSRGNEGYGKVCGGHSMLNLRDFQSVKTVEIGAG